MMRATTAKAATGILFVAAMQFLSACTAQPTDPTPPAKPSVSSVPDSPSAPSPSVETSPTPGSGQPTTADSEISECDRVADLFDMLVEKKAEGWVEADALSDMSARGEYSLGYVVDGVFGDRFGAGGSAAARVDTIAACRRMAAGGELY